MIEYGDTFADKMQMDIDKRLLGEHNCWNCAYMTTDSNSEPKCSFTGKAEKSSFEWCSAWKPCERLVELLNSK